MVKVYQRKTGELLEQSEYQSTWLARLYETKFGHMIQPVVTAPLLSELLRVRQLMPGSRKKITHFIETYKINLADFEEKNFPHFAAFFNRTVKTELRPICSENEVLAVADAKLQVFAIEKDLTVTIKEQRYSLSELLCNQELAQAFAGGYCFLYRLGLEDCHHYLAAETGLIHQTMQLKGKLHSVRELVQKQLPVFKENKRHYMVINTYLGPVLQMEIGALLVGAIHNKKTPRLIRGQEKGHFSFGGSSIIVLYPKGRIEVDGDILIHSKQGFESQVLMGEKIGRKLC